MAENLTIIQPTDPRWDEPLHSASWDIHITFEQGRGHGGVPRVRVPAWAKMSMDTLLRLAVGHMRAICVDAGLGHGRDLMPGVDHAGYELHQTYGGLITDIDQIMFVPRNGGHVAQLVLTYGEPNRALLEAIRRG